ncbi:MULTISPECIES: hypothetical protein [Saccharothrix]|uniref:hypothetical protein n=1 Tax=Saccharothrix TaxID=2071 RepID=UPI00093EEFAD|nr:hypothetical protein [Saccharothrix sp. CB00851]OKI36904.1 hypothetical protein A6A25_20635 [Saccharothrix sp. CB00851]
MGQAEATVSMGTWVGVWDKADIRCGARVKDQEVLVSFGEAEFELTLSRAALEECIKKFPQALAELDSQAV